MQTTAHQMENSWCEIFHPKRNSLSKTARPGDTRGRESFCFTSLPELLDAICDKVPRIVEPIYRFHIPPYSNSNNFQRHLANLPHEPVVWVVLSEGVTAQSMIQQFE